MPLLVLSLVAVAAGAAATLPVLHHGRLPSPSQEAADALAARPGLRRRLARADPRTASGLVLLAGLVAIAGGGVVLAALTFLVRRTGPAGDVDSGVADWGQAHATAFGTEVLGTLTDLGAPTTVAVLAAVLAGAETFRTRNPWVVPFVAVVVAGNGIATTTIKALADRVRPGFDPAAADLGPSFPSGHSSWIAALAVAAALLLGRGRGPAARAALTGAAVALAVFVAGSRVMLGVHWLTDVLAGLALGTLWATVCALAFGGRVMRLGATAQRAVSRPRAPRRRGRTSGPAPSRRR